LRAFEFLQFFHPCVRDLGEDEVHGHDGLPGSIGVHRDTATQLLYGLHGRGLIIEYNEIERSNATIELTEQQRQELNAALPRLLDPPTKKTYAGLVGRYFSTAQTTRAVRVKLHLLQS
jgi:hypothetical protein